MTTTTTTRTGVRYAYPGDDIREEWISDDTVRRQRIVDLIHQGAVAEPVTVTTTVDEALAAELRRAAARDDVLAIAQRVWETEMAAVVAIVELAEYSDLTEEQRAEALEDLVRQMEQQDKFEIGDYDNTQCDGLDQAALCERADLLVREAADKLIGGAA